MAQSYQSKNEFMNAFLAAKLVILIALASNPELVSAHRRYGSCGRSYRDGYRRWNDCNCGSCGLQSYYPRRRYNPAIEIIEDFLHVGMNSLARQQRESVAVAKRKAPRYSVEDHGENGLELTIEVNTLKARDIDLEISQKDGVNIIGVSGSSGIRGRDSVVSSEFSESFEINDDSINIDGVTASVSSGILSISLPRKIRKRRKRVIPSAFNDRSFDGNSNAEDGILVYDAKRVNHHRANKRSKRRPIVRDKTLRKSAVKSDFIKSDDQSQDDDDLYISEEEDIW